MKASISALAAVAMVLSLAPTGCGGKKTAEAPTPASETALTSSAPPKPVSTGLRVSDDITKLCNLRFGNVEETPKFDYDKEDLSPSDRDILQQIATCMTTGPLKGRNVQLVGRTDPRGTTEYNMALGERRSDAVDKYLVGLGVAQTQLKVTSRGELDATGTNDTSWQKDRRVDIVLQK